MTPFRVECRRTARTPAPCQPRADVPRFRRAHRTARRTRRPRPARRHRHLQTAVAAAAHHQRRHKTPRRHRRRIRPRRTLTGPQLPPELPQLAAAVEDGDLGEDHISAVCDGIDLLPSALAHKKDTCERILVRNAKRRRRHVRKELGKEIASDLNLDTEFDEQDRRRRSGMRLGKQQAGRHELLLRLDRPRDPQLRQTGDAAVRPGRHHPTPPARRNPPTMPPMPSSSRLSTLPKRSTSDEEPEADTGHVEDTRLP